MNFANAQTGTSIVLNWKPCEGKNVGLGFNIHSRQEKVWRGLEKNNSSKGKIL